MNIRWKMAQAAEIRWWKRYLKEKSVEDYLTSKRQYWHRVLATLEPYLLPIEEVLDAGCGPAGIFMIFPDSKVKAIDPLLSQYEAQLPHFSKVNYPNVKFENVSFETYVPSQKYDTIFCLNAINHVANIERSLDVLFDALKPGGQLIISTDAHKYNLLKKIFQCLPGDILHPHQYDAREYAEMLTARGGEILQTLVSKPGNIFDYVIYVVRK